MSGKFMVGSLAFFQEAATQNPGRIEQFHAHSPEIWGSLVQILVPLGFFAFVLALVWLGFRKRQAQIHARSDFHKQLLDRFSSGREFSDFLESKGSQRFLDELWSQDLGTRERILSSMRTGIVLATLGLGLLGLSLKERHLVFPAVIVLALGIGFLVATGISYRLSKHWEQTERSHTGSL